MMAEEPGGSTNIHWSLQKLGKPKVPKVTSTWPRNPIDHFVLETLRERQMTPSVEADRGNLLRRVYFDLIGLPPTPAEMERFLKDSSPRAYERVVDQLLASPRYGERWARHWIDLVHFAETHGHDQDRIRTNAWPYRDYLIESFNADKPYPRFVQEQLAADVLFPNEPKAIRALGFIAAGPWDESSLRDIREDSIDRQIGRYIDRDDMVATTMTAFTSSTVHCARCHNHKFDPISIEDYYSLQAVFAGVDRADRPYDEDLQLHRRRQDLLRQKRAIENKDSDSVAMWLSPEGESALAKWEAESARKIPDWIVLSPFALQSANGSGLALQADQSVLASGPKPEQDTYTFVAFTDIQNITGIRLELLTDDSLPHKGPGRQDNGNLHLSEFRVEAEPRSPADWGAPTNNTGTPARETKVELQNPTADFNQKDWAIKHALDGDVKTAWGIYPEVGKAHQAYFELKTPLGFPRGTKLKFTLAQLHGGSHLIGRFRLSITTNPLPIKVHPHPENIMKILAAEPPQRSREQRIDLAAYAFKLKTEEALKALPPPRYVYAGADYFAPDAGHIPAKEPRRIHILKRGDINRPGEEARPGTLSCVSGLPARFDLSPQQPEGLRRAALARWITDPENPLAWRSIVNRVWQHHFGKGLVETANDFGKMGAEPSHPELLDWLARRFRDDGGSFKQLHKLIVTSAAYRQSTTHHPDHARLDAANKYLWRMAPRRLEAETIRDAMLSISGLLDQRLGGPSFKNFSLAPGIHVTPVVNYGETDLTAPEMRRRSIYRFLFRTLPDPFMDSLDCPDGAQLIAERTSSITPLQALTMLNNQFVLYASEQFAARLRKERATLPDQIQWACQLAYGRPPEFAEAAEFAHFAAAHGLENFCRVLFNSNEFIFVN